MTFVAAALALSIALGPVDTLHFGRFGDVMLYRQQEHPSHLILFVSGDGGWNLGVVAMARELAGMDAAVAGIDIRHYRAALERTPETCGYPAADFEALSQWLQRRLGYPAYTAPVLVGYSSGATLVYAALAQAPPNTFLGALSLGFCPDLSLTRPLCRQHGLRTVRSRGPARPQQARHLTFLPADSVAAPWVVLQGEGDRTCSADSAENFVRRVRGAELVLLPKVGHGFGVESRWMPELREAYARMVDTAPPAIVRAAPVRDLPLVELPAAGSGHGLAVIVSGDGGWASLDRQIGETFREHGVSVVGVDALRYFWSARTPDQMGADLTRIARHYLDAWHRDELLLVGYSLGAETLPFMVSRLPRDLWNRIRVVALIGPARTTSFEFHVGSWLGTAKGNVPTAGEIARLKGLNLLCLYGSAEDDPVCPTLAPAVARSVELPGGHHLGGAYRQLAERILLSAGS
jgi:type IV secretory pathway VirJ component